VRRLALVATTAAACSVAAFVAAAGAAGVAEVSGFPVAATIVGAVLLVGGLLGGGGLALSLAYAAQLVGAVAAMEQGDVALARAAAAAVLLFVSVEATRLSIDARRPSRFDGTVLRRLARRTLLVAAGAGAAAVAAASVEGADPPGVVVVLGLTAALALVSSLGLVGRVPGGLGLRLGLGVLAAGAVIGLAALGASRPADPAEAGPPTTVAPDAPAAEPVDAGDDADEVDELGPLLVRLILFGALILVAVIIGGALLMPQAELDLEPVAAEPEDPVLVLHGERVDVDEVASDVVGDAVDVLDRTLLSLEAGGDPGRAVRFAYAQAETGFGRLDQPRRPNETESEFLDRMLVRLGVSGPAMERLTALFALARFSEHTIDEEMRRQAVAAVADVRADLVGAPVRGGGPGAGA
jgi:Domain of unknown function (DUF4129)